VDVFAFGWLAHLCMTGSRPHHGLTGPELERSLGEMLVNRRPPALAAPEGSPFREPCLELCGRCLQFKAEDRPSIDAVSKTLRGWIGPAELPSFGTAIASALANAVQWQEGVEDIITVGRRMRGPPTTEIQIDAQIDEDIAISGVYGAAGPSIGPWCVGLSLREVFVAAEDLQVSLQATLVEIRRGALATPLHQRFGSLAVVLPGTPDYHINRGEDVATGDEFVSRVVVRVFFPNGSGAISLRCTPLSSAEVWRLPSRRSTASLNL